MSNKYYYLNTEKENLSNFNAGWQSYYGKTNVIKGVVLHDSAGSMNATAKSVSEYTLNSMKSNPDAPNYHDTVDDKGECYAVIPMTQRAYHTGNVDGNKYYIGIEIAPSLASGDFKNQDEKDKYYKAWKNACKLVADYLCYYNLTSNDVHQHNEFTSTACPYTMTKYFGSKEKALSETKKQVAEFMKIVKGESTETDETIYYKGLSDLDNEYGDNKYIEFSSARGIYLTEQIKEKSDLPDFSKGERQVVTFIGWVGKYYVASFEYKNKTYFVALKRKNV